MRTKTRSALCTLVLGTISACAPPDRTAASPVGAPSASPTTSTRGETMAMEPTLSAVDDPRTVRCGVDDGPVDVQGQRSRAPDLAPIDRAFFGMRMKEARGRADPLVLVPPPPVPPNAPLERARGAFSLEKRARDQRPLAPIDAPRGPFDWQEAAPRADVTSCGLTVANDAAELAIEVRLSSLGLPLAATARASGLDDPQARCLGALGCRVALSPTLNPTTFWLRGRLAVAKPTLSGKIRIVTTTRGPAKGRTAKYDAKLLPLVEACAAEHVPAASFDTSFAVTIDATTGATPPQGPTKDAAGAIVACLADQFGQLETMLQAFPRNTQLTTRLSFDHVAPTPTPTAVAAPKP